MDKVYFISGIDTGVGKTVVTGMMARWLADTGHDVITVKMVQTGNDGFSEDRAAHIKAMGGTFQEEDRLGLTVPQIFKFPASPELAARLEGRKVDLDRIANAVSECAARRETVLVEGVGGMLVPLAEDILVADFAAAQGWPLVLVASARLGSVNHTLLSLEAAYNRSMKVAGVVLNWCEGADPIIAGDAVFTIKRWLRKWGFPDVVVPVPEYGKGTVDFSELFVS